MMKGVFLAVLFLSMGLCAVEQPGPLVILFTGSINGISRPCYCPSNPWGGLAKRAWLISEIKRTAGADDVLNLASGDLSPVPPSAATSALIIRQFKHMGLDALALGDQDLTHGYAAWVQANQHAEAWDSKRNRSLIPWLSCGYTTTLDMANAHVFGPNWLVVERAGMRIAIVATSSTKAWNEESLPENLHLTPSASLLKAFRRSVSSPLDLLIVLSHQSLEEDIALAKRHKDIDIIIGGHSQALLSPPKLVNGTVICQPGKDGENLGVLLVSPHRPRLRASSVSVAEPTGMATTNDCGSATFCPFMVKTRSYHMAHQIVPLNASVDQDLDVARILCEQDRQTDLAAARRLSSPSGDPAKAPRILLQLPTNPVSLTAHSPKTVLIPVVNAGQQDLIIKRSRSRSPWMTSSTQPMSIPCGYATNLVFTLEPDRIGRFFRGEFTLQTNDPDRPVIQAAFSGVLKGPLRSTLDVPALLRNLRSLLSDQGPILSLPPLQPLLTDVAAPIDNAMPQQFGQVHLSFFFAPGCEDCDFVESVVLADLLNKYDKQITLERLDVTQLENFVRLDELMSRAAPNTSRSNLVTVVVNDGAPLSGTDDIQKHLPRLVDDALKKRHGALCAPTP
ncbi:MAG: hypothetical protein KBA18_04645 [Kiritimatiellae bacterium]|jgi:hypothetical protein|nr:hypothetical protein [Kiritimatiellia bacterium]